MFESERKFELECAPVEGATGAAADCSGPSTLARICSDGGTTDVASVVSLAAPPSDGLVESTVGANSAEVGSRAGLVVIRATTGVGVDTGAAT